MTTQTEALKLAIKAMESFQSRTNGLYEGEFQEEINVIKEALSHPEQESVAVMELYTDGWDLVEGIDTDWLESLPFGTRLFSHPPVTTAQPEQEPVYQIKVYGSQTAWHDAGSSAYDLTSPNERRILYTISPQRIWVGLTDDEMRLIDPDGFEDNLPQMIQQALKEKNT